MSFPYRIYLYYQPAFFCSYKQPDVSDPANPKLFPMLKLWIQHPAKLYYQASRAFDLRLDETPSAIETVQDMRRPVNVDDHTDNGGYTSIGPCFPHAYSSGGVYLSEEAWKCAVHCNNEGQQEARVSSDLAKIPDDETMAIEWVPDFDPGSKLGYQLRRYHGFYGRQLYPENTQCQSQKPREDSRNSQQEVKDLYQSQPPMKDEGQVLERHARLWVVWHSGTHYTDRNSMNEEMHWRAPRKLWIPDAVVLPPALPRSAKHHTGRSDDGGDVVQPLYLDQSYANYVASLDVPKQPSASGEGQRGFEALTATQGVRRVQSSVAHTPQPPNLNIISEYAPGEVSAIKDQMEHYLEVRPTETLVDALSRYLKQIETPVPRFTNLDLIGHSRTRDRIIKIGEFAITSRVAKQQFRRLFELGILRALGIKAIRLLGCRTATAPRGERVVRAIRDETGLDVYAARADLFAVHFNNSGFREAARSLLADYDVITYYGAGDLPPRDDYPAPFPADDDDGSEGVIKEVPPPERLTLTALSDVNAAAVSAKHYLFWDSRPPAFDRLVDMVYAGWAERDNRLNRADYEVLLQVAAEPRDISDFRSFDLFLDDSKPRLRVNYDGVSYAFFFKPSECLRKGLSEIGIVFS